MWLLDCDIIWLQQYLQEEHSWLLGEFLRFNTLSEELKMISEQVSHTVIWAEQAIFDQDLGNARQMLIHAALSVAVPVIENHLNEVLVVDHSRNPEVHSRLYHLLLVIGEILLFHNQLDDGQQLILKRLEVYRRQYLSSNFAVHDVDEWTEDL